MNVFSVVKQFEDEVAKYTGAPYCVAVNSCTMALLLACAYHKVGEVSLPKFTYNGVPMSVIHAGGRVTFRDEDWTGEYQLTPYPIWDSARRFTSGMYRVGNSMQCVSFHWSKILGIQQGGAILHDDSKADQWLRKARFDGRTEGVAPKDDTFTLGYHCYMSPEIAAEGLVRLSFLPQHNADLPRSDYPDLSLQPIFKSPEERLRDRFRRISSRSYPATIPVQSIRPSAL
jgi:dTDP-4-amino-4,6-dideoxygalactose transaminase